MAKIALVWELGADLGHLFRFRAMARGLTDNGHEPVFVVRDPALADPVFVDTGVACFQAPIWSAQVRGLPPPINLTESLFRFGYLDMRLAGLVAAWRALFRAIAPDLLVVDSAPTATLAARGLGVPTLVTGASYSVPPVLAPLPPFDRQSRPPAQRLDESEARVLTLCRQILKRFDAPPIDTVSALFDGDARLICGYSALDVYGPRPESMYCGPITQLDSATSATWPGAAQKRIFAYIKPRYESFVPTLKALARSGASCLVAAPGLSPAQARQMSTPTMTVHGEPLNMAQMCAESHLGISHAGAGMIDAMLGHGVPMLLFPTQWEQRLVADRAVATGSATLLPLKAQAAVIEKRIAALLEDPTFKVNATGFSFQCDRPNALSDFVDRCEVTLNA